MRHQANGNITNLATKTDVVLCVSGVELSKWGVGDLEVQGFQADWEPNRTWLYKLRSVSKKNNLLMQYFKAGGHEI